MRSVLDGTEREILELAATGASSAEIAARLQLAQAEVDKQLGHILRALRARSKPEAIVRAYAYGLISAADP